MAYMGRKMHSNSLYFTKGTKKYMTYKNRGKRSEKIANLPEIVSFMYQNAQKNNVCCQ